MRKSYSFISGFTILGRSFFHALTAFLSSRVMAATSLLRQFIISSAGFPVTVKNRIAETLLTDYNEASFFLRRITL